MDSSHAPNHLASGASGLWERGCVFHSEPVGQSGLCTEGLVQEGDAGELYRCGFPGVSIPQTGSGLPAGERGSSMGPRSLGNRGFERHLPRWVRGLSTFWFRLPGLLEMFLLQWRAELPVADSVHSLTCTEFLSQTCKDSFHGRVSAILYKKVWFCASNWLICTIAMILFSFLVFISFLVF